MIRDLHKKIGFIPQIVILAVLSSFFLFYELYFSGEGFLNVLEALLTTTLVLGAVWVLFFDEHYLASYLILFLSAYAFGLHSFVEWMFSYNFGVGKFSDFEWSDFILLIGAIYLALIIVSYFLKDGFKVNKENFQLDLLIILFSILMFFGTGVVSFIYIAVIEFIAINFKKMASLMLMLSKSLIYVFSLFRFIFNDIVKYTSISNWLLAALSIVVIVLIVKKAISILDNKNPSEKELDDPNQLTH